MTYNNTQRTNVVQAVGSQAKANTHMYGTYMWIREGLRVCIVACPYLGHLR